MPEADTQMGKNAEIGLNSVLIRWLLALPGLERFFTDNRTTSSWHTIIKKGKQDDKK
jgi:hypothetical protein